MIIKPYTFAFMDLGDTQREFDEFQNYGEVPFELAKICAKLPFGINGVRRYQAIAKLPNGEDLLERYCDVLREFVVVKRNDLRLPGPVVIGVCVYPFDEEEAYRVMNEMFQQIIEREEANWVEVIA
jgi:hypothetical protein